MTLKEAENIILNYEKWEEAHCFCFMGHVYCGKCENIPSEEKYEEACIIIDTYDK